MTDGIQSAGLNVILLSERALSDRLQGLDDVVVEGIPVTRQIWDITRLQRQQSSRGQKKRLLRLIFRVRSENPSLAFPRIWDRKSTNPTSWWFRETSWLIL